jgi:hypothetical protein
LTIASELSANPSAVPGKDTRSSVVISNKGIQLSGIAGRVIAASPILEAFGNAKTIRNPNSSRFGKWLELVFNSRNALSGSVITSYLLEKSRVTRRDPEERNYHIFYQLLRGIEESTLQEFDLQRNTSKYRYLERTGTTEEAVDLNDAKNYGETMAAFKEMGFDEEEITTIQRIIAGVLHLGNIDFVDKDHGEASAVEANNAANRMAAGLFSVQESSLANSLCHRSMTSGTMRRSVITITLSPQMAMDARDTLARTLYDKIFLDIIAKINIKSGSELLTSSANYRKKIGLLDIFGFEIFPLNSLEQLCINYCNEMLQNHFNFVIFTAEKNLYAAEGITCNTIEFKDNLPIIQDIDKLFKTLDEEAKIPKGTSKTWYEKLRKAGAGNKTSSVLYPPRKDIFTVKHYAGNVDYSPLNCMEKNTEVLTNELIMTMAMSSEPSIQRMFGAADDDGPSDGKEPDTPKKTTAGTGASASSASIGKKVQKSISWKFTNQLTSLMTMLKQTQSHFVRTVKSNEACRPLHFDAQLVNKQLLYSGVFEVVKIQQSGLPCRLAHRDFIERFMCLTPTAVRWKFRSPRDLIITLKSRPLEYDLPQIQSGASLVFFKTFEQRLLECKREQLLSDSAIILQTFLRCKMRRRLYQQFQVVLNEFMGYCNSLESANAKRTLKAVESKCAEYEKVSGYPILAKFLQRKTELVEIVRQRELLIIDANALLGQVTEESLVSMQKIVQRATELDVLTHPDVNTCHEFVIHYEYALSFIEKFSTEQGLSNLTMDEINTGIDTLTRFIGILEAAEPAITRASQWRIDIESEFEVTFKELMSCLEASSMKYDEIGVEMRAFNPDHGVSMLSSYHKSVDASRFKCKDTKDLYEDCATLLHLMEIVIPNEDGEEALRIVETTVPHYEITEEQFLEIKSWATIHVAVHQLQQNLLEGRIPGSAIGNEDPVNAVSLHSNLAVLKALPSPPPQIYSLIVVADWIYLLRQLFLKQEFAKLEQATYVIEEEINLGHFDSFPTCIKEFENCIWLSSYQNALADVFFIINEPVFSELPTNAVDWSSMMTSYQQGNLALDTAFEFSSPTISPALNELIPLARNILHLHHAMFDMDVEKSNAIVHEITKGSLARVVRDHNLLDFVTTEINACKKLIAVVECEEELNAALLSDQVTIFQSANNDGTTVTSKQCSIDCSGRVPRLRAAVDAVHAVAREDALPISLVNILFAGEKILYGRDALANVTEDASTDWDAVAAFMLETPEGKFILDDYQREFDHILIECSRRSIWQKLKQILAAKCLKGTRYMDVHIDQAVFSECEATMEQLLRRLADEIPHPPGNLMHLLSFVQMLLTVRRSLLNLQWPEVYSSLAKLQPLLNDDGLAVPGVIEEIDTIRNEYVAHQEIIEMKDAIRDTLPFITDEISIENKQMRLDRIEDAIFLLKRHTGSVGQTLVNIAQKVMHICARLMHGEVGVLPESSIMEVISLMESEQLNIDEMQQILQFVRLRQILKTICDAISEHATSDLISHKLDTVRGEHTMPKELLPWLHAADAYSQLLQAIEHLDWVLIVNRCRYLEEVIEPLAAMERHDTENENILIEMARLRYREGYKLAMKIKEDEAELLQSATTADVSMKDMKRKRLIAEDESNPYGVTALRKAGFSDSKILESHFPLPTLWALGFDGKLLFPLFKGSPSISPCNSASLLRSKGFNLAKLKSSGYSCADLIAAGYTVDLLGKFFGC